MGTSVCCVICCILILTTIFMRSPMDIIASIVLCILYTIAAIVCGYLDIFGKGMSYAVTIGICAALAFFVGGVAVIRDILDAEFMEKYPNRWEQKKYELREKLESMDGMEYQILGLRYPFLFPFLLIIQEFLYDDDL